MSEWSLRHPEALAGLILVALLWWRLRRVAQAQIEWTGALSIWKRLPALEALGAAERGRSRLPGSIRAALGALCLGVLALADPMRTPSQAAGESWRLVVDRSAAMYLPLDDSAPAPTRVARAVDLAVELCESHAIPAPAREWQSYARGELQSARGARPPPAWLLPDAASASAPPWASLDLPGTVWLSDGPLSPEPSAAGLVLSGAQPVAGPVADLGLQCWFFDGQELKRAAWSAPRSGLAIDSGVPPDIAELAAVWADSRGLPLVAPGQPACLSLTGAPAGAPSQAGLLRRATWSAPAVASGLSLEKGLQAWGDFETSSGQRCCAVAWRPGEILLSLGSLEARLADPAALALDWSELFETACLSEPGVVALAQRLRSAPEQLSLPAKLAGKLEAARSLAPWSAALACALVLLSIVLAAGRARSSGAPIQAPARPSRASAAG